MKLYSILIFCLLSISGMLLAEPSYDHVTGDVRYLQSPPESLFALAAKSKVKRAIAVYKHGGLKAVVAAFPDNQQTNRYVAILNENGRYIYGNIKAGEKKNIQRQGILKDRIEDPKLEPLFNKVKAKPQWVRLNWINPENNLVEPKIDYLEYYDGNIFSSGFYLTGSL